MSDRFLCSTQHPSYRYDMNSEGGTYSWEEMRGLVSDCLGRGPEIMGIVSSAGSRPAAAQGIADLLDAPVELADQLLDSQLADFIGCAKGSSAES